ncbi:N-acetylmuramoyl-L-alanine amidase [Bacillus pseudomycoides]|uniref:GH25 family lysozyme n=1 Tax=Bacillus pseudomycoides TaxID=64104 RepID=UPI000BF7A0B7|nr:GH25 family lysozyme [Bacillus pseudomycoides]MBD5799986.1 N-acetylmuramoyl-L-alanine amidase [Bacillus pseudomycoides]MDR4190032.1 N-acetylmuramoyl-L-alanine amidase [Bacillus pseudomycoides]MED0855412.1 GH25 family lysozyme [Bacillus pseudomycoides]MED1474397.1 GH25 family lysozyme [Bacillus pseudomycoides]PEO79558.1 N-acetylmuramoyl-L-alanine amidase [Bacillus pseudomycoides]
MTTEKYIVDISKFNDKINWDVAAPQLGLAICRVQYGSNKVDELYNQHVKNLEARGIPHAAYAYGCYVSVNDAIVEAKDFLNRVNKNAKFLVLDVEDDTVSSMESKGNLGDLAKASQAFIDTCKAAGWKVGLYVSHHMYNQYNLQNVKANFIWLPRYGTNDGQPQVKPAYPCDIWQYTDNGYINGIGRVDINLLRGDKTLDWYIGDDVNTIAPSKNVGIGIAISKYSVGYGINLYDAPDGNFTGERFSDQKPHPILAGVWYGGNENMLCFGPSRWAKQEHFDVQWFRAYSKYPPGYGINTYSAPGALDGSFKGQVDGTTSYDIYSRDNGWVDIGNQTFVKEEHFNIK